MPEKPPAIQSPAERRRPGPEPVDLTVLYEDDSLIAIDKPAGMVVHPTYKNWSGTLLNGLLWRYRERHGIQPSIITRLDKDTSGLVLVALTPTIHARVQRDGAAGRVKKEYLAIVRGAPAPPSGTISLPLARDIDDRRRVVVTGDGQPCETRYEVRSSGRELSLVHCELVTGRTHQIRVHLAASGWPVVGDATYGVPHAGLTRQALHAWRVSLPHPLSGETVEVEAPLPPDLQRCVDQNFTL